MASGKYIALEGGDGSGKSTVAAALAQRLAGMGTEVLTVREPGGTPLGEAVRDLLLDSEQLDDWAEAFLFAAQRAELARTVVGPALSQGKWVVSDRSYYSSIAYQGAGRGLGEDMVRSLNERGLGDVTPDLVVVLDLDTDSALARQHRADRIGGQGAEFQQRVRESYQRMAQAEPERVRLLDASAPLEDLVDQIVELIR